MIKDKPQIFIASSAEGLDVAYAMQELLEHNAECTVWDQGVFKPSSYNMIDIINRLNISDYGIFVFSPDDSTIIRGEEYNSVRDNVMLELGLFMGAIGREKCFIIIPNTTKNKMRLPTDLAGIQMIEYNPKRRDGNLSAALGPAVNKIRKALDEDTVLHKSISESLVQQVSSAGLSSFYSSRDDYAKYRTDASSIDKYLDRAKNSIHMVSITLSTGIAVDDICKLFKKKLKQHKQFEITISLLNPFDNELYRVITPLFNQPEKTLQNNTISAIKNLIEFRNTLAKGEQRRFNIRVHNTLPFGSAIVLDGDTDTGTIQIETKPYDAGMRKSFAFEIENNGGAFYETLKHSYYKLIEDGMSFDEINKLIFRR